MKLFILDYKKTFLFQLMFLFIYIHRLILNLRSRTFFLFFVKSKKRNVRHLHHLKSHSGNITDGMALTTETCHQNFVILLDVVEATVSRYESCDLLAILNKLYPDALANSRVWLFSFYSSIEQNIDNDKIDINNILTQINNINQFDKFNIRLINNHINAIIHTLFLEQCLQHGKLHQRDQPSIQFQDAPFCSPYRSIAAPVCDSHVYALCEDLWACL